VTESKVILATSLTRICKRLLTFSTATAPLRGLSTTLRTLGTVMPTVCPTHVRSAGTRCHPRSDVWSCVASQIIGAFRQWHIAGGFQFRRNKSARNRTATPMRRPSHRGWNGSIVR